MRHKQWIQIGIVMALLVVSMVGYAQAKRVSPADPEDEAAASPAPAGDGEAPDEVPPEEAEEATPPPDPHPENTLELCQDEVDNDLDGHADCDDQDCEIYAICVDAKAAAPPEPRILVTPPPRPEQAWQCKDGVDNDKNGLVDCHESACQLTRYCKRQMYVRPEPADKAPGLMVNFGFGVALPNYRVPSEEARSTTYGDVPFDPDMGLMLDLQVGYMFLKWVGVGINFKTAFTAATNREAYLVGSDDEDDYKYLGSKFWGNLGGFVRFQWPFKRIVPYLNIHAGYSATQFTWHIYDADNDWEDIYDYESEEDGFIEGRRDVERVPGSGRSRHFVFALEPGFDAFPVSRLFGVGLRAWLPVVGNKNSSYDNVGVLLNFTFTPMWREAPKLKPEYAKKP